MKIYKFHNCYLNTRERRVLKEGQFLDLTPKTFDVLQLLVEKPGKIISKDEILGTVWNGSFVEEGNLAVHISKLRRLLETTEAERFIETVHGMGYRFTSQVDPVSRGDWLDQIAGNGTPTRIKPAENGLSDSIAVLPFRNESDNPEIDYLSDGLTESLINSLSHIGHLKVIARDTMFRYKNTEADAKEVGETLGVTAVVTGRIKLFKDQLIISVDLVKVQDGTQIWGTRFNQPFSDIIDILNEITLRISEQLRAKIADIEPAILNNQITRDPESYRFYLRGKHLQEKYTAPDTTKAIEFFQRSVSFDPANVHSYVQIIECYFTLLTFDYISHEDFSSKTRPILAIISKLNESVDAVQAMYGGLKLVIDWEFEAAENHFRHALDLNPGCLAAHFRYSKLLICTGRYAEALDDINIVMQMDPLSLITNKRIGRLLYIMGRHENALIYLSDALELEPADHEALSLLGAVMTELGRLDEALAFFQKSLDLQRNVETLSMIGYVLALSGDREGASGVIKSLKSEFVDDTHHSVTLARIYAALGEIDNAVDFLNRALDQRDVDMIAINVDPRWNVLRPDERFRSIVAKIGLPQLTFGRLNLY